MYHDDINKPSAEAAKNNYTNQILKDLVSLIRNELNQNQ